MVIDRKDKHKIIALANKGLNANEIRKSFRKYTRQQIAGIIAWVTRGKY